jgi:hypothetical protein
MANKIDFSGEGPPSIGGNKLRGFICGTSESELHNLYKTITGHEAPEGKIKEIKAACPVNPLPAYAPEWMRQTECKILKTHDDGDLTVQCEGKEYIITTDGTVYMKKE